MLPAAGSISSSDVLVQGFRIRRRFLRNGVQVMQQRGVSLPLIQYVCICSYRTLLRYAAASDVVPEKEHAMLDFALQMILTSLGGKVSIAGSVRKIDSTCSSLLRRSSALAGAAVCVCKASIDAAKVDHHLYSNADGKASLVRQGCALAACQKATPRAALLAPFRPYSCCLCRKLVWCDGRTPQACLNPKLKISSLR